MRKFGQAGGTLWGIFIGLVIGVLISFGAVLAMNHADLPFQSKGGAAQRSDTAGEQSGTIAPLPGKPGDKVGNASSGDKSRFDFYKILPGGQEAAPKADAKPADAKGGDNKTDDAHKSEAKSKEAFAEPQYLQVGSFQKPSDADNLRAKLALIGLDAGLQEVDLPEKGKMYRVRTGPYSNVEEMNRARTLLSQNGIQFTPVKGK